MRLSRNSHIIGLATTLVLGIACPRTVSSQQPFHALVLTTGATTMSVDALNASLTSAHFAGLSNDAISYGASGYFAFGRALIGADVAQNRNGEEGLNNGRADDLSAVQWLGTVSIAVVASQALTLFPTLGVGMGHFDVTLRDGNAGAPSAASPVTFADLADRPGSRTTVEGHHLLYSIGAGVDYLVTREGGSTGVVLGVRAGMLLAPNRTTWSSGGRDIIAGPDASAGGPFVRLAVGIGGR